MTIFNQLSIFNYKVLSLMAMKSSIMSEWPLISGYSRRNLNYEELNSVPTKVPNLMYLCLDDIPTPERKVHGGLFFTNEPSR
jgi:hypothetical protein